MRPARASQSAAGSKRRNTIGSPATGGGARARPATFEMPLAYPSPVFGQVEPRGRLASHAARPPGKAVTVGSSRVNGAPPRRGTGVNSTAGGPISAWQRTVRRRSFDAPEGGKRKRGAQRIPQSQPKITTFSGLKEVCNRLILKWLARQDSNL